MINHKIVMKFDCFTLHKLEISRIIRKCIGATLQMEGVNAPCEINVLITNDQGIREINRATRNLDKPTDVLSFPMFSLEAGNFPKDCQSYMDPETGKIPLGDMAVSLERAIVQAKEYGHSSRKIGRASCRERV